MFFYGIIWGGEGVHLSHSTLRKVHRLGERLFQHLPQPFGFVNIGEAVTQDIG